MSSAKKVILIVGLSFRARMFIYKYNGIVKQNSNLKLGNGCFDEAENKSFTQHIPFLKKGFPVDLLSAK